MRCHADLLVPAALCTLAKSSRGKVLAKLADPVEGGRRTYTPQYAPDKARDTTPRVYVIFHPGALVPAFLFVHAATLRRPPRSGGNWISHLKEGLGAAIMRGSGPLHTTICRLGWGK